VIAASVLFSTRKWALPLLYAGHNSIVVYLAFFLPMATTRILLLRLAPALDLGLVALVASRRCGGSADLARAGQEHVPGVPVRAAGLGKTATGGTAARHGSRLDQPIDTSYRFGNGPSPTVG